MVNINAYGGNVTIKTNGYPNNVVAECLCSVLTMYNTILEMNKGQADFFIRCLANIAENPEAAIHGADMEWGAKPW